MDELNKLWQQTLKIIKDQTTPVSYKTWFLQIRTRELDKAARILYLEADEDFVVNILNNRYLPMIEESVGKTFGQGYKVIINNKKSYDDPADSFITPEMPHVNANHYQGTFTRDLNKQNIFNPKYTFDNFVVGNGNRYAQAAALAVAEAPSQAYNPLFIYGGSGLGKTHLMHAIGIYLLEHNEDINVLYVSSEMFTNELIKALGDNNTRAFKNKYRKVDVLLIDDIQFLEGK
ncbi:MAG: DnaA ATPase domain-containing protein, partial [Anaerovoracaceae bacterium]